MTVDLRLLPHFLESRRRHEAARRALPERWRADPRPEVQEANETWVSAVVRARELAARLAESPAGGTLPWTGDDR
ncbi:MAG TPA: hypothetical protein VFB42_12465 [Gaiellaceae bacterium]|nr:hypothetical protein [Gaiellaceae bacterium]